MLMEIMGLHLPGAAFVNPGTPLRTALTGESAKQALHLAATGKQYMPIGHIVDEKSICNAIVGLMATGGSTNHTIHLVAIARAAGIIIDWDDFNALSQTVPLLTHVYPSGHADVNQFQAAGGISLVIRELLDAGMLHDDVNTVAGNGGISKYTEEPFLENDSVSWRPRNRNQSRPGNCIDRSSTLLTGWRSEATQWKPWSLFSQVLGREA